MRIGRDIYAVLARGSDVYLKLGKSNVWNTTHWMRAETNHVGMFMYEYTTLLVSLNAASPTLIGVLASDHMWTILAAQAKRFGIHVVDESNVDKFTPVEAAAKAGHLSILRPDWACDLSMSYVGPWDPTMLVVGDLSAANHSVHLMRWGIPFLSERAESKLFYAALPSDYAAMSLDLVSMSNGDVVSTLLKHNDLVAVGNEAVQSIARYIGRHDARRARKVTHPYWHGYFGPVAADEYRKKLLGGA